LRFHDASFFESQPQPHEADEAAGDDVDSGISTGGQYGRSGSANAAAVAAP
jgi:hypothetical protein